MLTGFATAVGGFLGDMFKGPNGRWDFGRLAGFHVITAYSFGWLYALIKLHSVPDWTTIGNGYLLVVGGVVALIAGKDIAVAKANVISASPSVGEEK